MPNQVQVSFDPDNWDRNFISIYDSFDHHVDFASFPPFEFDRSSLEQLLTLSLDLFLRQIFYLKLWLKFCLLLIYLVILLFVIDFLVAGHILVEMLHI